MSSAELIQAIAATAELCGAALSEAAAKMLVRDLSEYPEEAVLRALTKVRRSGKRFSLGAIIEEIDAQDGRPGAAAAWAMIPRGESETVVWTEEMAKAWGVAAPLLDAGDKFGASRAFAEEYERLCEQARERGDPVRWTVSMGSDPHGREAAIRDAVEKGRLPASSLGMLPPPESGNSLLLAMSGQANTPRLEGGAPVDREKALRMLKQLRAKLTGCNSSPSGEDGIDILG